MSASATALPSQSDRHTVNAANALHSTGPVTQEGKERAKFNALKSGLYARTVVLPGEDQPAYETLGLALADEWAPRTGPERELVLTIQNTRWRLNRVVELESSIFAVGAQQQLESVDQQFGEQPSQARHALARAQAYMVHARTFEQLSRQEGRLQRALIRAERELAALIAQRNPVPNPAATPAPDAVAESGATIPTGFVPSEYPTHMPDFAGQPHANEKRRRWLRQNGYKNLN